MDISTLQAESREARGSRAAERLRKQGKLPGIIYGHGETPENVTVTTRDLSNALHAGQHVVQLALAGGTRQVLIKDVQFDHLAATPVHVDFVRVDLNERVTVSVKLEYRGTPVGANEGGIFEPTLTDLDVDCLVTEIPELIRVSIADMKLGDALHVRDIQLPPNVTTKIAPETIVCAVRAKVAETAAAGPAEEGAEAQEPEIITRREKTEEGAEDDK